MVKMTPTCSGQLQQGDLENEPLITLIFAGKKTPHLVLFICANSWQAVFFAAGVILTTPLLKKEGFCVPAICEICGKIQRKMDECFPWWGISSNMLTLI